MHRSDHRWVESAKKDSRQEDGTNEHSRNETKQKEDDDDVSQDA